MMGLFMESLTMFLVSCVPLTVIASIALSGSLRMNSIWVGSGKAIVIALRKFSSCDFRAIWEVPASLGSYSMLNRNWGPDS